MKSKIYKRIAVMVAATMFTTTIPVMASDVFSDNVLGFSTEEDKFLSDSNENLPEVKPDGNIPEVKPDGNNPEVKPDGNNPEVKPDGNNPEVKPDENVPEVKPDGNNPEIKPDENTPEVKPDENNPEIKPDGNNPEVKPDENNPDEKPAPNEQIITVDKKITKTYGDRAFKIKASCLGGAPLTFKSRNSNILKVSSNGKAEIKKAGRAVVLVTAKAHGKYPQATKKLIVEVKRKPIKNLRVIYNIVKDIQANQTSNVEKFLSVWDGKKIVSKKDVKIVIKNAAIYPNTLKYVNGYIEGRGNYTGRIRFDEVWVISKQSEFDEFLNTPKGPRLTWKEEEGAVGYVIFRKNGDGRFKRVKVITDYRVTSWTDTQRAGVKDTTYYYMQAYSKNHAGKTIYNKCSEVGIVPATPVISSIKRHKKNVEIFIEGTKPLTGYQIQRFENGRWKELGYTRNSIYIDKNVFSKLKNVRYRVRAYKRNGYSLTFSQFSAVKAIKR